MNPLLPPNASNLEKALSCAIQTPTLPVALNTLWAPETCPAALLPWLAWSLGVDNWSPAWPESTKRSIIADAISAKRMRGTRAAVENALAQLGAAAVVREWWEVTPQGEPNTFGVAISIDDIEGAPPSAEYMASIPAQIDHANRKSQHYTLTLSVSSAGGVGMVAGAAPAVYRRLTFDA